MATAVLDAWATPPVLLAVLVEVARAEAVWVLMAVETDEAIALKLGPIAWAKAALMALAVACIEHTPQNLAWATMQERNVLLQTAHSDLLMMGISWFCMDGSISPARCMMQHTPQLQACRGTSNGAAQDCSQTHD